MKLYERYSERGYHTSIATTFGIEFDAYENAVLPRLRGAGCFNNVLIADGRMLTHALSAQAVLPRQAGRLYMVCGAPAAGVFHPKLFVQLGRRGGRMIVSSANMSASGLAGNLEIACEIACDEVQSGEQQLVANAWQFVSRLHGADDEAVGRQLSWARSHAPWLRRAAPATGTVTLADGTAAALLTTGGRLGIAAQFIGLVGDERVKRLIVVSPYWDPDLRALEYLTASLGVQGVALLIDPDAGQFPGAALRGKRGIRLYDRNGFRKGRFLHAKIIIAQTRKADHVLLGSANCTVAALGRHRHAGSNEEVCLYRRLPGGEALDALELEELFKQDSELDAGVLKPPLPLSDLGLKELAARTSGRFECNYDTLHWMPPEALKASAATIELMDADGKVLPCRLTALGEGIAPLRRYQITGTSERPSFARIRHPDGSLSAPAIVALIDQVRVLAREPRSKQAESAAAILEQETEEGLWLCDLLSDLESIADTADDQVANRPRGKKDGKDEPAPDHRVLSYEEFIVGRRERAETTAVPRSTLAGSETSLVRDFLNRILETGAEAENPQEDTAAEDAIPGSFDLGDETPEAMEMVERGDSAALTAAREKEEERQERARKRKAARRKATADQIIGAVEEFNESLAERKSSGALKTTDLLRLRMLLMIVAAAGWSDASAPLTSLQVLPCQGSADSWPRALGRLLFGFFGGNDPAIRHVRIDQGHDQLTDDMLECWATCFWAVQACLAAPARGQEQVSLTGYLTSLAQKVYRLTGLMRAELTCDSVITVMDRLSARFGKRLAVDGSAISGAHKRMVGVLFQQGKETRAR